MKKNTKNCDTGILLKFLRQSYGNCNPKWCTQADVDPKEEVYHVFPVAVDTPDRRIGLMVGLEVRKRTDGGGWQLSDAFGRMGFKQDKDPINEIFPLVEDTWRLRYRKSLPLRWRNPATLYLKAPVHLDMIDGKSLQVPLLLTLLRVAVAGANKEDLPFGPRPVFSTGSLGENGTTFYPVDDLAAKAQGFIREYGEGLPAILMEDQEDELRDEHPEILSSFEVYIANNISELIAIEPLFRGLNLLCKPPNDIEVDHLLLQMEQEKKSQRFSDVDTLCSWLLPSVKSHHYRALLLRHAAELHSHRGNFKAAKRELDKAQKLQHDHAEHFGLSEQIHLIAIQQDHDFDIGAPEESESLFHNPERLLKGASLEDSARYWGAACQLFRALGRYDDAIRAGHLAVGAASKGAMSERHRDANYLVHAYLARARASEGRARKRDLAQARKWLRSSTGRCSPIRGTRVYDSHSRFCAHLDAEISRMEGTACVSRLKIGDARIWGHAALFYLLSVARNSANSWKERVDAGLELIRAGDAFEREFSGGLFPLFNAIGHAYCAYGLRMESSPTTDKLREVLKRIEKQGAPGWARRLTPFIEALNRAITPEERQRQIELLCDVVYFF